MLDETRTPTMLPTKLKPLIVTVAARSPAVELMSPVSAKPRLEGGDPVIGVVMMVWPTPWPMRVSSLLIVAPAKVPVPTRMVSPLAAASTASWMVA